MQIDMTVEMVDSREFAAMLGVKPKTVINYLSRETSSGWPKLGQLGTFPQPAAYVAGRVPVWRLSDAQDYVNHRPGPGWHEKGDERIVRYIKSVHADADEPATGSPAVDQPAV